MHNISLITVLLFFISCQTSSTYRTQQPKTRLSEELYKIDPIETYTHNPEMVLGFKIKNDKKLLANKNILKRKDGSKRVTLLEKNDFNISYIDINEKNSIVKIQMIRPFSFWSKAIDFFELYEKALQKKYSPLIIGKENMANPYSDVRAKKRTLNFTDDINKWKEKSRAWQIKQSTPKTQSGFSTTRIVKGNAEIVSTCNTVDTSDKMELCSANYFYPFLGYSNTLKSISLWLYPGGNGNPVVELNYELKAFEDFKKSQEKIKKEVIDKKAEDLSNQL